ncbi:two-component system, NarL family, response regulator DesR [Nonomuraea maritima]|uniref:Two-component system, NarL family, response regulator DesR n=1 Tax=Nonomuraea maritima TaxID=683260 RepID=A0A1G9KAE1_9ACTN|nr:response regulator transcription factor [Nonomuraea maritima]SDL46602.1 two-component system, NarL family, response regulator DesR [Nonomuraea maritima]
MLTILLAEDQHVVRGALVALLELESDLTVVTAVGSGDQVLPAALEHRPDVAVLDIDMPVMDGLAAATALRERLPECRVLLLTGNGRPGHLRQALAAGVGGFLLKTAPPEELIDAIHAVAAGRRVLDPKLAVTAWDLADNPLTPRDTDVLRLVAEGTDAPEIAAQLHLTAGTVRNYLTAIVAKLNARNRTDAVRIASEAGWI